MWAETSPGAAALRLGLDTSPRLRFRVDYGARRGARGGIRVTRVGGGESEGRVFVSGPVNWLAAPPGTWTVSVSVQDIDGQGAPRGTWIEVGLVTTGEPEKTLVVPP